MASDSTKNTYGNEDGNVRDLSPESTGYNPLFGESRGSPGSPLALCYRPLRGLNTKSKRPNSRAAVAAIFGPVGDFRANLLRELCLRSVFVLSIASRFIWWLAESMTSPGL